MLNGIFDGSGEFIDAARGTLGLSQAYKSKKVDSIIDHAPILPLYCFV